MPVSPITRTFKPLLAFNFWQLTFPISYFIGIFLFHPFRGEFAMDLDEGINLIKALLVVRGRSLYTEIWNDQPPLLTYLLAALFKTLGLKIVLARLLILALACLLVWALIRFLWLNAGRLHAIFGFLLLVTIPQFVRLSVSVMVGLPAIVFAMLSLLCLALWHRHHRYPWLVLSALALGLSVMTKLMTGFLVPIFLIGLLVDQLAGSRRPEIKPATFLPIAIWGLVFVAMLVLLTLWVGPGDLWQLYDNHLAVSALDVFKNDPTLEINYHLRESFPLLIIALFSLVFLLRAKNWLMLYPLAWWLCAYLLLLGRTPSWSHHQLLVTIPAVISAAYALGEGLTGFFNTFRRRNPASIIALLSTSVCLVSLLAFLIPRVPKTISQFNPYPSIKNPVLRQTSAEVRFLTLIRKYARETHWIVTDQPMYAFRTELSIPPNLAVFTATRVYTGQITEAEILETIQLYRPEQVLFGLLEFPSIEAYLKSRYELVHSSGDTRLYIRQDVSQRGKSSATQLPRWSSLTTHLEPAP